MVFFRRRSIDEVEAEFNFDARRRSVRILVIDDDPNSFDPFKPLEREGYAIDFWENIRDFRRLEQGYYDIIVLDIRGVGTDWSSKEEGFGILELLKSRNPSQIVVAYSGETFDFSKGKFYRMADDMIPKSSVDPAKCKNIIDNLIATRLSPANIWNDMKDILLKNGVTERKIKKLESKITAVLQESPRRDVVEELIKGYVADKEVWASIVILITKLFTSVAVK